jgi:hypothetical protein
MINGKSGRNGELINKAIKAKNTWNWILLGHIFWHGNWYHKLGFRRVLAESISWRMDSFPNMGIEQDLALIKVSDFYFLRIIIKFLGLIA